MSTLPHTTTSITIPAPGAVLEALLQRPQHQESNWAAIICHPHPLYGGTMHSKVVFTAAQAMLELGIPCLRFNFRGVGKSTGRYDSGTGELLDLQSALNLMLQRFPAHRLIIIGHSFGAYIGMKGGCRRETADVLMGIGMPVDYKDIDFLLDCNKPRLFIHGTADELIPLEELEKLYSRLLGPRQLSRIQGADHLFTGKLIELQAAVQDMVGRYL